MTSRTGIGTAAVGLLFAIVAAAPVAACGSEDTALFDGGEGGPLGDSTDESPFTGGDGSDQDGAGNCLPGEKSCGGVCVDVRVDTKNCGACGNACVGCQICSMGSCVCPLYQTFCNGQCIPTSSDPDNCGACGKVCANNETCSGGSCVPLTMGCIPPPMGGNPGLVPCNRRCTDPFNDSQNCNACGNVCAANTGCVDGQCVALISVGPAPMKCTCGGPPISLGPNTKDCLGNIAQGTFRWALCSCSDITLGASLLTASYDSTKGPYPPNPKEYSGGVGLNGTFSGGQQGTVDVGGAFWSSGANGVAMSTPSNVRREGHIGHNLTATNSPLKIWEDDYAGGNVTGTSAINIVKTLYVDPNATVAGNVTFASKVTKAVSVLPPCDDCGNKLLPIATWITAAATKNDNALINLDPNALATAGGGTRARLELPCGVYYLTKINKPGTSVTVFAKGRTALFIDGDVVGNIVSFVLDPNAEFDVFIKGTITTSGELVVGSPNHPALSRTYIGGSTPLTLSGEAGRTGGNLYAAYAPVNVTSHLVLYGGLNAGSFSNQENAEIHYDRDVLTIGKDCPPPPPMCGDCKDCNNQACINGKCDMCTNSSQCCPPLVCINGTCKVNPN